MPVEVWRAVLSGVVLAMLGWAWHQQQRLGIMWQHLFGATEGGHNGTAQRIALLEEQVTGAMGDAVASPAGRELSRRLDALESLSQKQGELLLALRTDVISQAMSKVASQMTAALADAKEELQADAAEREQRFANRLGNLEQRILSLERRRHP